MLKFEHQKYTENLSVEKDKMEYGELIKLGSQFVFYPDNGSMWTMNDLTQINDKLYRLNNVNLNQLVHEEGLILVERPKEDADWP
jgi:hypothetical protein